MATTKGFLKKMLRLVTLSGAKNPELIALNAPYLILLNQSLKQQKDYSHLEHKNL